jgi:hypothetical protein
MCLFTKHWGAVDERYDQDFDALAMLWILSESWFRSLSRRTSLRDFFRGLARWNASPSLSPHPLLP